MVKKILSLSALLIIIFTLNTEAAEPKIQYIFDELGVMGDIVVDQSGNKNHGKITGKGGGLYNLSDVEYNYELSHDGRYMRSIKYCNVEVPFESFENCDTYTWSAYYYGGKGWSIFRIYSDAGMISIDSPSGTGYATAKTMKYSIECNENYYDALYYKREDGTNDDEFKLHNFTMVHDKESFRFYLDGERLEPYYNDDDEYCDISLAQILSGNNPEIILDCTEANIAEMSMYDYALTDEEIAEIIKPQYPFSIVGWRYENDNETSGELYIVPVDKKTEYKDITLCITEWDDNYNLQNVSFKNINEMTVKDEEYYFVYTLADKNNIAKFFVWDRNMKPYVRPFEIL